MKIRKARLLDVDGCLFLQRLDKTNYWKKEDFVLSIKDKGAIFLVAEEDKKIVGYVIGFMCPTKKTDVMVHETRVNKNFRRKNIGTALVAEFCSQSKAKGVKNIYALIEKEHVPFYVKSCKFKKTQDWIEVKR